MHTKTVQFVENGKKYAIDVRNHDKNIKLLEQCKNFKQPYLIQYVAKIEPNCFNQNKFAEDFKRGFKRIIKQNKKP